MPAEACSTLIFAARPPAAVVAITVVITILLTIVISLQQPIR
jgi:hypothetical protein